MALKWHKETEYTVVCSNCGCTESICDGDGEYRTTDTPSKYFGRQGWQEIRGRTLCPDCVAEEQEG